MSEVSVIGCGAMGSALITTFASAGYPVTIWNRTADRARSLAGPKVDVAEGFVDAVEASPLTILSVADHGVARALLQEADGHLADRTVIGVSFATPEEAGALHEVVAAAGGRCLDLAILAYPSEIGTDQAHLLVSGDHEPFVEHRARLEVLGTLIHAGELPGAAFVNEMAVLLPYLPMAVSLMQGAKICELHGVPLQRFAETVQRVQPAAVAALLERMTSGKDPSDPANIEASVEVWADGAAEYADYLAELGLDTGMYDALQRQFTAAIEAGRGEDDWTCIAEFTTTERRG